MENNIENEATKEFNAESEGNVVDQISTRMMGLLGQIEDFVSSLHDGTPSIELAAQRTDVPSRLENAVRLLTMARDEVAAELDCYNLFEFDDDERKHLIEQFEDSIDENQAKSNDQSEVMKSHIDDCIKLGKVRSEMSRVMNSLSARVQLIRAHGAQKSCTDPEDDAEGAIAAVDSGICSSETEDCAAGGGHVLEGQVVQDLPTIDEVAQSIQETALNVSKIAEDAKQVSKEIDKIDKIVQKHRSLACSDEQKHDEVREKSDFEETEKSDCTLAKEEEKENASVSTVLGVDVADSSCSESTTEDETEPETPSDDERADQTHMGNKMNINGIAKPSTILREHLMRNGVGVEYYQVNSEDDNSSQTSRYNYRCRVLDLEAKGEGRNKAVAKLHVAINMLSLLAGRQEEGTLPSEITPFTPAQLKGLEPILRAEVESSSISFLRKECSRMGEKMPSFKTLSHGGPCGEQIVTTQCTALNYTAVGCGRNKRRARRDAANRIVNQYFKSAVDQEQAT